MASIIQLRRDTTANWTTRNPILAEGELGFNVTNLTCRLGDGINHYLDLEEMTLDSNIVVGTTTTLSQGSSATVVNSGDAHNAIFDFGIPAGYSITWLGTLSSPPVTPHTYEAYYNSTDRKSYIYYNSTWNQMAQDGPQGIQGIQGIQGVQGNSATIAVGTTTTLSQGSSATVTNIGDNHDAIFNFGIPIGLSLVWLGVLTTAPSNPNNNDAYYNSTDKKAYVYYNGSWSMIAQDGPQGIQGIQGIQGVQGVQGISASFNISALHLDIPLSADWPNQNVAETVPDPVNNALFVAQYDDTTAQLRGTMPLRISQDATNINIRMYHRSQTAPSGTKTMAIKMYYRKITDGIAVPSWSNTTLTGISIPDASNYFNVQDVAIALSTLSLSAGDLVQFAFERDVANDSLIGNWLLLALNVRFS